MLAIKIKHASHKFISKLGERVSNAILTTYFNSIIFNEDNRIKRLNVGDRGDIVQLVN